MNVECFGFHCPQEKEFPSMLVLEITNVCNFRCIHCPYPRIAQRSGYMPKFMNWDVYAKIIEETAEWPKTILRFVCDGEPMMHPDFIPMVIYAKKKNIAPVCITTNGYFLTGEHVKAMLECECDVIEVSLDALREESYNKIRIGGDFHRVINNIHQLIHLRNTQKRKTKIMVSIINQPLVVDEIEDFKHYWEPMVDRIIIRALTSVGGLIKQSGAQYHNVKKQNRWPCPMLWRRLFINVDGYAEFCVDDWLDKTIIADTREKSISEIWQGEQYQLLREYHRKGEFALAEKCAFCLDWPTRTWEYDYFHALEIIGAKA
ncbi:MAG: radical SAM protein [Candidatus Omnitrophota bacterium]